MKQIIFFFLLITSCKTIEPTPFIEYEKIGFAAKIKNENINEIFFNIVYEQDIIIHPYLEKNTLVKITNLSNKKNFESFISEKKNFPSLNQKREVFLSNSIFKTLDLDNKFPLIKIESIKKNSKFVAGDVEIFEEEKKILSQIRTDTIEIIDISNEKKNKNILNTFYIYYGDFAFKDFADQFLTKIKNELGYKKAYLVNSNKKFRIIVGEFNSLNAFDDFYKKVLNTNFENFNITIEKI